MGRAADQGKTPDASPKKTGVLAEQLQHSEDLCRQQEIRSCPGVHLTSRPEHTQKDGALQLARPNLAAATSGTEHPASKNRRGSCTGEREKIRNGKGAPGEPPACVTER
jgi:hypothetical protein